MDHRIEARAHSAVAPIYAFGAFQFDAARGLLTRGRMVTPLPARLSQLLGLLIHTNGNVIDKETIASLVWPDGAVSDGNLSQHMYMLRQLLDERANDRNYIMTVRGRGYRFVAPVSVVAPEETRAPGSAAQAAAEEFVASAPELLRHYWRGSYLLEKRTARALAAAAEQFEAALRLDPSHVPSLVGLARSYASRAQYWYAPGSYTFPKAKAAIVRALEIDASSAEARATLGTILLFCDWNWPDAEREIETALRLGARSTSVYVDAAWFYTCKASGKDPLRTMQEAVAIEPSSPGLQLCLGRILLHTGQYRRAIDLFSSLIESIPDLWIARGHRAQALVLCGEPAEALTDLLLMPEDRAEDIAIRLPLLGRAYADSGDLDRAEAIYRSLQEMAPTEHVVRFNLAMIAVGLGRLEEALDHLEQGVHDREPALLMLRTLPWFSPIAQRARFKALQRAVWPFETAARALDGYSRTGSG